MVDRQFLSTWIQLQHLDASALGAYREAFTSHPSRVVVIRQFLVDAIAEKLSRFLASEALFQPEFGLYSVHDKGVPEAQWQAARSDDRFFRFGKLVGIRPEFQFSPNALKYLQFRKTFGESRFRTYFEEITGLPLTYSSDDIGAHAMSAGDYLRPHSDNNRNRRIALVLYLTPGWEPGFGGALQVVNTAGHVIKIDAEYNSVALFDVIVDTKHFVTPIKESVGDKRRLTLGGWYHNPE